MANRCYLYGSYRSDRDGINPNIDMLAAMSYGIPAYWLCMFDAADVIEGEERDEASGSRYPHLVTRLAPAIERLSKLRKCLVEAIDAERMRLLDELILYLESVDYLYIHLDSSELWMMSPERYKKSLDHSFNVAQQATPQSLVLLAAQAIGKDTPTAEELRSALVGFRWVRPVPWEDEELASALRSRNQPSLGTSVEIHSAIAHIPSVRTMLELLRAEKQQAEWRGCDGKVTDGQTPAAWEVGGSLNSPATHGSPICGVTIKELTADRITFAFTDLSARCLWQALLMVQRRLSTLPVSGQLDLGKVQLLPLRDHPVAPGETHTLVVSREKSIRALQAALQQGGKLVCVSQKNPPVVRPALTDLEDRGVEIIVWYMEPSPDRVSYKIIVEAVRPVRLTGVNCDGSYAAEPE